MGVTGLDSDKLALYGMSVVSRSPAIMTIEEIENNLFGRLEEIRGFCFVAFPDQVLDVVRDEANFVVFGMASASSFHGALALDDKKRVQYLIDHRLLDKTEKDGGHELERNTVNHSLEKFIAVYCLYVGAFFRARAYAVMSTNVMEQEAQAFIAAAEKVDEGCTAPGTFWNQLAYELEDGFAPITRPLLDYIETGRFGQV